MSFLIVLMLSASAVAGPSEWFKKLCSLELVAEYPYEAFDTISFHYANAKNLKELIENLQHSKARELKLYAREKDDRRRAMHLYNLRVYAAEINRLKAE